jgi:hypothetical protein
MFAPLGNGSLAVQMPGYRVLSLDGGRTFQKQHGNAAPISSNLVRAPNGELHDFGNISASHTGGSSSGRWTSVTSPVANYFSVDASGALMVETRPTPVRTAV